MQVQILKHILLQALIYSIPGKIPGSILMKIKDKTSLFIAILIPLLVGSLSALFSGGMSSYPELNQPPLSPPSWVFPVVWTILYILMGISSYIIYESDHFYKEEALIIYGIQLFFNFFWSILFFRFSLYLLSFLWLLAMILLIIVMIRKFREISPLAALLQIPYLIWCIFAAYLNFGVYLLN